MDAPRGRRPSDCSLLEYDDGGDGMLIAEAEAEAAADKHNNDGSNDGDGLAEKQRRGRAFFRRSSSGRQKNMRRMGAHLDVNELTKQPLRSSWERSILSVPAAGETCTMHAWIDRLHRPTPPPAASGAGAVDWFMIEARCLDHPHEAVHLDRRGRSCLHAACAKKPPVAAVAAIARACGRNGDTCLERDKHGRTPLAIAICTNASLSVIALLLRECPKATAVNDHLGHLPLHLACSGYDGGGEEEEQAKLVEMLLDAFPQAASRESFNGRTPLHAAMEARAPVNVAQLLVEACPEAVVMNGCGLNPLFVAIRFNASVQLIRCLVRAHPAALKTRDRGNGLPLRRAIENQCPVEVQACLSPSREVVLDVDPYIQNTALHSALECGTAKEGTVDIMIRLAPDIATKRSKAGKTPLSLACQWWQRLCQHSQQRSREGESQHLGQAWRIVVRLMRAAFYGPILSQQEHTDTPALHAAVSLFVSREVVENVVRLHATEAPRLDAAGRHALHLAIENRPPLDRALPLRSAQEYLDQKEWTILQVFRLFPAASHRRTPREKRLPLHLAAGATSVSVKVLKELWSANPAGLVDRDPVLFLYPFQIAALPKATLPDLAYQKASQEWRRKEDLLQLGAIYELLKQSPQLMQTETPVS